MPSDASDSARISAHFRVPGEVEPPCSKTVIQPCSNGDDGLHLHNPSLTFGIANVSIGTVRALDRLTRGPLQSCIGPNTPNVQFIIS